MTEIQAQKLYQEILEMFLEFMNTDTKFVNPVSREAIEYFLAYWVPKYKQHLEPQESRYLLGVVSQIMDGAPQDENTPYTLQLLEIYKDEYVRLYSNKKLIESLLKHPVIKYSPTIISLQNYQQYKKKQHKRDIAMIYDNGHFIVEELGHTGYILLRKMSLNKYYKVVFSPTLLTNFKIGDVLHITVRKKIFFEYWEIYDISTYYPKKALTYLF
ncbi:MAG: hypothetical protein ATN35_04540 [Epulopiscium sp. Nele67-Bin004]|nr:MAG: hypothetical protein ATN35_04540 [Epulopiscium sp. Nele67-Bin004]